MNMSERRIDMPIFAQAQQLGFIVKGSLSPAEGQDTHCQYYHDEAGNTYIVRRGILTIIAANGRVY
jgi:hypothetical protein